MGGKLSAVPSRDLSGQRALITGANTGIGKATLIGLLESKVDHVTCLQRTPERMEPVKAELEKKFGEGKIEIIQGDLGSFDSIKSTAKALAEDPAPLDIVILNAGVMVPPFSTSPEGFESQFACNHLGHFILTQALLPKLREQAKKTGDVRFITLASSAHNRAEGNDYPYDWIKSPVKASYSAWGSYGNSKLANVHMTKKLAQSEASKDGITFFAVHPGVVNTELGRHMNVVVRSVMPLLLRTPTQGAATSLTCVLQSKEEANKHNGSYYQNAHADDRALTTRGNNQEQIDKLWQVTLEWTGVEDNSGN